MAASVATTAQIGTMFEFAFYSYDNHFFIGPKPGLLPSHENLFYPFDKVTWALLTLCLIGSTAVFLLLYYKDKVIIHQ